MNKIVTESAANMRGVARNTLEGHWGKIFVGVLLYYLMISTVSDFLGDFFPTSKYLPALETYISYPFAQTLYAAVMTGPLTLGLIWFIMRFFRNSEINPGYIFNGFGYFLKSFGLMMMEVFLSAWPLMLSYALILAIIFYSVSISGTISGAFMAVIVILFLCSIAAFVYMVIQLFAFSQSFYLMATSLMDHTEVNKKGIIECLMESKRIMKGNKAKLFVLELSYIGWGILAILPMIIVQSVLANLGFEAFANTIGGIVSAVPLAYLYSYYHTGIMVFHDILTGRLVASSDVNKINMM